MESNFELLEEKVRKAADLLKRLKKENKAFEEDLLRARTRLHDAEKRLVALEKGRGASPAETRELEALIEEIRGLRREREEVRRRVAKLVETLDGLE